jgi:hypothetical protein
MNDDLVKRLRYDAKKFADDICGEAADRIEELEAALVVFAKRSEWYDDDDPDNLSDWDKEAKPRITIGDLRRARTALENKNER